MKGSHAAATVFVVLAVALPAATFAAKTGYKAQASQTFINRETAPAHGLVVVLSAPGEVVTDASGVAGPFRNIRGNGTAQIAMTNPGELIPVTGDGAQFELTFRTQKKSLKVTKWWWTDAKGKPLGSKKKG